MLMDKQKNIRNMSVIAHVDHGRRMCWLAEAPLPSLLWPLNPLRSPCVVLQASPR